MTVDSVESEEGGSVTAGAFDRSGAEELVRSELWLQDDPRTALLERCPDAPEDVVDELVALAAELVAAELGPQPATGVQSRTSDGEELPSEAEQQPASVQNRIADLPPVELEAVDRGELLERYGRVYGELHLAIAFTECLDPARGDPKRCSTTGWDKTRPLATGDLAAALVKGRGQKRNPVVVLRTSGLIGLECDTPEGLAQIESLGLPATVTVRSSEDYKRHFWFRPPNGDRPEYVAFRFEKAGVTADTGRYLLVPPALHPSGAVYTFLRSPEDTEIAVLPDEMYAELVRLAKGSDQHRRERLRGDPDAKITEGQRRETIFRFACSQVAFGAPPEAIHEAARALNRARCEPPLSDEQVAAQVDGALGRYEPGTALPDPVRDESPSPAAQTSLDEVVAAFRKRLHLPDPGALLAALATIAANRLEGDPVWLLLVGPPGGGKSEILGATSALSDVHAAGTLTEPSLLSGVPRKEHAADAKGGLLRRIGSFGILCCKDFGSILSMNRDSRAQLLAALREIYDGAWTRHVGTEGGRTLHWSGKVGLLGGCTPAIDRHHGVMASMGERLVLYRLPEVDARAQARSALAHAGHEKAMRAELAGAVAALFTRPLGEPRHTDDDEVERLVTLSTLVVRCRSAVERDGYSREIELIPDPEAPTRLIVVLGRLLDGLDAIGVPRETAWQVVTKAALDSIPALRLAVLQELLAVGLPVQAGNVGAALGYPQSTVKRALEDLAAHGLVEREPQGQGKANRWSLSAFALDGLRAVGDPTRNVTTNAEREIKSETETSSTPPDISGWVPGEELEAEAERLRKKFPDVAGGEL